jgi:hypothetical protein
MKKIALVSVAGVFIPLVCFLMTSRRPPQTPFEAQRAPVHAARSVAAARPVRVAAWKPARNETRPLRSADSIPVLPLEFEENRGQGPSRYRFFARGPAYSLGLSPDEMALSLRGSDSKDLSKTGPAPLGTGVLEAAKRSELRLQLSGANRNASVSGLELRAGVSNYFIGSDPSKWRRGVPHYGRVKMTEVYPGIDLLFYGNPKQLEYDFRVSPGADPGAIQWTALGEERAALDPDGGLLLTTASGNVRLKRPVTYQEINGERTAVPSRFRLEAGNRIRFEIGAYDHSRELIIDPVLLYGVTVGGSNGNQGVGVEVDKDGNAYVTGNSCSTDFPTTAGKYQNLQSNPIARSCEDAFVMKLNPTASTLIYSDFVGGNGVSTGGRLSVDSEGDVFVAGATSSTDFPLISNIGPAAPKPCAVVASGYNCPVGFVFKLNPDGSNMIFSTLLGGSGASVAFQATLNPASGDLQVLAVTNASNFKPAPTTLETKFGASSCKGSIPCINTVVLGLDPLTGAMRYGTFFGGAWYICAAGMSFDPSGNIYIAGAGEPPFASSLGKITHTYPPKGAVAGGSDIFVAKLHLDDKKLTVSYLTVIEGEQDNGAAGVAVDKAGNAYIIGSTASLHLPVTPGAFQSAKPWANGDSCLWPPQLNGLVPNVCGTGFVAKLNAAGELSFLTYLGGNSQTWGDAIGVDSKGNLWLTGVTSSTNFPFSADAYKINNSMGTEVGPYTPFLAEMSNDGAKLPFATEIAGAFGQSTGLTVDSEDNVYVTGFSGLAPTTPGVYPINPNTFNPVFVQKWSGGEQPKLSLSPSTLNFPDTAVGNVSAPQTLTARNTGSGPLEISAQLVNSVYLSTDFFESDNCQGSLAPGASCNISVRFEPQPPSAYCVATQGCVASPRSSTLVIANNAAAGAQTFNLYGNAGQGALPSIAPTAVVFPLQTAGTVSPSVYISAVNSGDISLYIKKIALTGLNAADFTVTPGQICLEPISPGIYCSLGVTFSPAASATGTRTASIVITDSAASSPQTISLTGTASSSPALEVLPNFGTQFPVAIGNSAEEIGSIQLLNPAQTGSINVTSLTVAGTNKADFAVTPSCSATLPFTVAAGASCYLDVNFNPLAGASGLRTATVTIGTTPAEQLAPVILQADAVTNTQPGISLTTFPTPIDFGSVPVGQPAGAGQSPTELLSISNYPPIPCGGNSSSCGATLKISSITAGLSDYKIATSENSGANCLTPPITITSTNSCVYMITFTPSKAGNRNSSIVIKSNDPEGTQVIPLLGTGTTPPVAVFEQSTLNFGGAEVNAVSPPLGATLKNTGQGPLTILGVAVSKDFAIASNGCKGMIAPGKTCNISVTFKPVAEKPYAGTLTVTDNDPLGMEQVVNLQGAGATGPSLLISPAEIYFGNQRIHVASAPQLVTLTNMGSAAVDFPEHALRTSTDFILESTTCGTSLAPGKSCAARIEFKPSVDYLESGTLLVTDNAPGNPQPVTFVGTGVNP